MNIPDPEAIERKVVALRAEQRQDDLWRAGLIPEERQAQDAIYEQMTADLAIAQATDLAGEAWLARQRAQRALDSLPPSERLALMGCITRLDAATSDLAAVIGL